MANVKITGLPAASAAALTQVLEIVNDPSGTPTSQKVTLTQIKVLLDTIYQAVLGYTPVNRAGDTMTGDLTFAGGGNPTTIDESTGSINIGGFTTIRGNDGAVVWSTGSRVDSSIWYGNDNQERVDFHNRFLMHDTTYASIDWGIGAAYSLVTSPAPVNTLSVQYYERQLYQDDDQPCFLWSGLSNAPGMGLRSMAAFKDITFQSSNIGVILEDRTTGGNFYRLWVDNGVLSLEAVLA